MEQVINFIQTNYIWFIIGLIVIVMTVIGYFAEKSGFSFGEAKKNTKEDLDEANGKTQEKSVELADINKEGIADMIKDNNEDKVIPNYDQAIIEQPVIEQPIVEEPEEKIELQASNEDLYKPLGETNDTKEEEINGIPEELYAPLNSTPVTNEPEKIELETVTPFKMETEESKEPVEDVNSEYSRLFPSDPIIIGGEEKKEEQQEETAQEDIWNV